ncbi:hypothetical protein BC943DRAFT_348988 [Umbelopsis sp. AD052]|nr:hypothetical protein BC943DRAFT_348988 [Umbelopsis sp. AD052]
MNAPLPHDISRIVALWWREASPETKEYYRSLSNINAARYDPSQVVPTGKLSRTPRIPKAPKQQLLCMGHLRVTLPRYLKFVQEANDAIRLTCVPKYETLPSQSPMAFPPTPYKPYVPLVFPYRIQHIECHCHTCELPISSIATPIADDKVEEQDNDVDVGDINTEVEVEVEVGVEVEEEEEEEEDEKDDDDDDDDDNSDDDNN